MKVSKKGDIRQNESIKSECALLKVLNSPYLVKCEEVYEHQEELFVILELFDGDLAKVISKHR